MLTFLLICVAIIAIIQLLIRCVYYICIWAVTCTRQWVAEKRKPKPPVPPKPKVTTSIESNSQSKDGPTVDVPSTFGMESEREASGTNPKSSSKTIANGSKTASPNLPNSTAQRSPTNVQFDLSSIEPKGETSSKHLQVRASLSSNHMAREESFESVEDDICCTNFASLIKQKAKGFTHPYTPVRGRSPPAKPPKPSAEAIARARSRNHSFGEDIPAGKQGFRYADDESTESSVDYKDVIFDHGRVVAIELIQKPFTNEEKFELMLRQLTPSPPPSHHYERPRPPRINIESYDDDNVFVPSINSESDFESRKQQFKSSPKSSTNASKSDVSEYGTPNAGLSTSEERAGNFGAPDNRHSWPATKRRKKLLKGFKRLPPARPPPPAKGTKFVSFSDDETTLERRADHLLLSDQPKDKPPRPPPPAKLIKPRLPPKKQAPPPPPPSPNLESSKRQHNPNYHQNDATVTHDKKLQSDPKPVTSRSLISPRAPPRQRRFRSRTVELTSSSWRQSLPEVNRRRTLSMSDKEQTDTEAKPALCSSGLKDAAALKALYTQVNKHPAASTSSLSTASLPGYNRTEKSPVLPDQYSKKFQFRPLPPPPAPPRTHPRKSTGIDSSPNEENVVLRSHYDSPINVKGPQLPIKKGGASNSDNTKNNLSRTKSDGQHISNKSRGNSRFFSDLGPDLPIHVNERSTSQSPMPREFSPGRTEDLEDGGHAGDVDSSVNSSRQTSVERSNSTGASGFMWSSRYRRSLGKSNVGNRSSVFYCDLPTDKSGQPELESDVSERASFQEKSVQTSPEFSAPSDQVAEDSDELMDIANNLRMELNSILLRHQSGQRSDLPKGSRGLHHQDSDSEKSSTTGESQGELYQSRHRLVTVGSARSSEASWNTSTDESEEDVPDSASSSSNVNLTPEEKQKKRLYFIAKELMTSEENFVEALRLLNVGFRGAIREASLDRGASIVPDEMISCIFRYLPQLQNLNENLLDEIKERLKNWSTIQKISDILVKIGPFLKLYSCYIRDFEHMTVSLDENCRKYPLFAQMVKEFESGPQCQKLALKHFLLKPVQRIPQYRLLLQDYLNHLDRSSPDYEDTSKALRIVSEVADHANETMKQGDNFLKLVSIQNSILTRHEIVKPGRVFLKEGELMKLSRKVPQPRWFILFNDSLLYLTSVQQGIYRVNHELPLTGMKVSVTKQADYGNEFSIITTTRSFSLAAKSAEEREEWISLLNHAIDENAVKRSSFLNMQMQQKGRSKLSETIGGVLGLRAPVWIPDTRVTMCQLCTTEFTITYRRHHCRACGRVICSSCSANRAGLKYLSYRSARVCNACYTKLREEYEAARSGRSPSVSNEDSGSDQRPLSEVLGGSEGGLDETHQQKTENTDNGTPVRFLKPKVEAQSAGGRKKKYLPSVLKEVRANDQGSDISGYLHMFGRKAWKRYWFVLKSNVLYTYKASEDVAALKSTPLLGFQVEEFTEPQEGIDGSLLFKLLHKGHPHMMFYAETVGSTERWIKAMKKGVVLD